MSFMKKGYRKDKLMADKKVKAHVKAFYTIMDQMQEIADNADLSIEYNEDNIDKHIEYHRELDPMEKFLVLGKIHEKQAQKIKDDFYERTKDNDA